MALIGGMFLLASLVIGILALFPRSPVRKWYAGRQYPRRAAGLSIVGWFIVFTVLLLLTPDPPQDEPGDETTEAAPTSAVPPPPPASTAPTTAPTTAEVAAPGGVPADTQEAQVQRIVDGDTLELAAVNTGAVLTSTDPVKVRLLEIDTPETKHPSEPEQCYGQEATARLTELTPPGSTVWVQRDQELHDRYERHLLYLWNDDGDFVNLEMVQDGYAQARLYQPNDLYWEEISVAEQTARSTDAGLWGACAYFGERKETPDPELKPGS